MLPEIQVGQFFYIFAVCMVIFDQVLIETKKKDLDQGSATPGTRVDFLWHTK